MSVTSMVAARVRDRLDELAINPSEAARRAGLERSFIHDLLGGRKKTISSDALVALADALSCTPEYLVGRSNDAVRNPAGDIQIAGIIEPGTWRDSSRAAALPLVPASRIALSGDANRAFLARGPSAARLGIVDGTVVITAAVDDGLRNGETYVVRRQQGKLEELSIRIAKKKKKGDAFDLVLPSDGDPDPTSAESAEVSIIGKVVKAVTLFANLS